MTTEEFPEINTLTAEPILRLILALAGQEPPLASWRAVWPSLCRFAELEAVSNDAGCCFAVEIPEPAIAPRTLVARFYRQLSDGAAGYYHTRAVGIEFTYELASEPRLELVELWSADFPTVRAFLDAVEASPTFEALAEVGSRSGEFLTVLSDSETDDPGS